MHYDRTVIGYHGCDATTAERVLSGESFKPSENEYDWLGKGIYFWEYGLDRAWRWAEAHRRDAPAVVGAVIQLGRCFDLLDTRFTKMLEAAAPVYIQGLKAAGKAVPKNKGTDRKGRFLDCALINVSLAVFAAESPPYQCVRGAFTEGDRIYSDGDGTHTELWLETHVQIAVRDESCIVGTFRPRGLG